MSSTSPATFMVAGSSFTPNGSATIQVLNSSGAVVATTTTSTDEYGSFNVTPPSSLILSIGLSGPGTYNGSVVAIDSATGSKTAPTPISLTVTENYTQPPMPTFPFYIGKSLENSTTGQVMQVFGVPLNSPSNAGWSNPAYVNTPTNVFDFSLITEPCEAVCVLYVMSNFSAATTITFQWVRDSDGYVFYNGSVPFASAASQGYSYWVWAYAYSFTGFDSWEMYENGYYHCVVTNQTTGETQTVRYLVVGINGPIGGGGSGGSRPGVGGGGAGGAD